MNEESSMNQALERFPERMPGENWSLPHECSEPRPRDNRTRIADEVLTILSEAALENEQIDKAMPVMGVAQNLHEAKENGPKSLQMGLAQAAGKGFRRECRRRR